jgi:hypothetical protein
MKTGLLLPSLIASLLLAAPLAASPGEGRAEPVSFKLGLSGSMLFNYDEKLIPRGRIGISPTNDPTQNPALGVEVILCARDFNFCLGYQYLPARDGADLNNPSGFHNPSLGIDWFILNSPHKTLRVGLSAQIGLYGARIPPGARVFGNSELFSSLVGLRMELGGDFGADARIGIDPTTKVYRVSLGMHLSFPKKKGVKAAVSERPSVMEAAFRADAPGKHPVTILFSTSARSTMRDTHGHWVALKSRLNAGDIFSVINRDQRPTSADMANSETLFSVNVEQTGSEYIISIQRMSLMTSDIRFVLKKKCALSKLGAAFASLPVELEREFLAFRGSD